MLIGVLVCIAFVGIWEQFLRNRVKNYRRVLLKPLVYGGFWSTSHRFYNNTGVDRSPLLTLCLQGGASLRSYLLLLCSEVWVRVVWDIHWVVRLDFPNQ